MRPRRVLTVVVEYCAQCKHLFANRCHYDRENPRAVIYLDDRPPAWCQLPKEEEEEEEDP